MNQPDGILIDSEALLQSMLSHPSVKLVTTSEV